eukprot:COSAG01_NODE_51448_length_354_cov_6.584314_1_plen_56_part_01
MCVTGRRGGARGLLPAEAWRDLEVVAKLGYLTWAEEALDLSTVQVNADDAVDAHRL